MSLSVVRRATAKVTRFVCSLPLLVALSSLITLPQLSSVEARDLYEVVPAETSYALRIQGSKQANSMITSGVDLSFIKDILKSAPPPREKMEIFARAAALDFIELQQNQQLGTIGVDLNTTQVAVYGFGPWPVASIQLADVTLFKVWVFKHLSKVGVELKSWEQKENIYDLECDPRGEMTCLLTFADGRVSASFTLKKFAPQIVDHLSGAQPVKKSLKASRFVEALAKNAEAGTYTSGFLSFQRAVKTLLGQGKGLNKSLLPARLDLSGKLSKVCVDEYLSIVGMMPDIYLGQEDYQPNQPNKGAMLWRFNGPLAKASGTLSAKKLYRVEDGRSLLALSLAMDVPAVLQAVQTLMQSLVKTPYQCPHLSQGPLAPERIQQGLMMTQLVPPFVRNIRGVSVSLLGVTLNPQQPPQVDALAIITSDQAPMLLQFLKGAGPRFKDLVVPQVGAPAGPVVGFPVPPQFKDIKWKVTQDTIGIALGNRAVKTLEESVLAPRMGDAPLLSVQYRMNDLYALFRQGMNMFAPQADPKIIALMKSSIELLDISLGFSSKGLYMKSIGHFTK